MKIPVISVVGPTATGKTDLGIELALKFGGEIISADSMQIYKEFNILSAKASPDQLKAVPHHFIDYISIVENFSVANYVKVAHGYIKDINFREKIPTVVGGTGFYIDSLLKNIKFEKRNELDNPEIKKFLESDNQKLFEHLKKIDPKSAEKLHFNDNKRLKRAIEFFYTSGYPISEQVENSKKIESNYKICKIGLNFRNRKVLYKEINSRVDKLLENGLLEEVSRVSKMSLSKTAQGAIGYKEILEYIQGRCDLKTAVESLKQATRRYAKRQITWFKRDEEINWIYIDEHNNFGEVIALAKDYVEKFEIKGEQH